MKRWTILSFGALVAAGCASPSIESVCRGVDADGLKSEEQIGQELTVEATQKAYMRAIQLAATREGRLSTLDVQSLDARSRRAFKSAYGDGARSYLVTGSTDEGKVCGGGSDNPGHCRCFSASDGTDKLLSWLRYFK